MTIRDKHSLSICWRCKNACGGCSWSRNGEPIDGWTADCRPIKMEPDRLADSYEVFACPQFEYEDAHEFRNLDPDGIKALALGVLTRAMRDRKEMLVKAESATGEDAEAKRRSLAHSIRHLEKVFDPDGLWMQLAGLDDRDIDRVIAGEKTPRRAPKLRDEFKQQKGCEGCAYWRTIDGYYSCCHYYLDNYIRRPCKPGRGCKVRVTRRKGEQSAEE